MHPSIPASSGLEPASVRVLHVSNQVAPHIGGLETVVAAQTHGLRDRGWQVSVLTSADTLRPGVRDEDGVRTVRLPAWNPLEDRFGVPFNLFSPRSMLAIRREIKRADLVHVHDVIYLLSWVAAFWCVALRVPYVVHRHVGVVHHPLAVVRLLQWVALGSLARFTLAHSRAVLPIDERIGAELRADLKDPSLVEVVPNGVDTDRFRPAPDADRRRTRVAHRLPEDRPLALFVGRNVPKKGFATVVAAAGATYDIAFAGGELPTGPVDSTLHFLGPVDPAEMPAVYACADVMVIASVGECPLTVLEGMSSGLPLLVNDDPALRSPWTAGPGVRFVDMAGGGLPAALASLVADPVAMRALGAEGHAFVQQKFSWVSHVDRLEAVYQRVLATSVTTQ